MASSSDAVPTTPVVKHARTESSTRSAAPRALSDKRSRQEARVAVQSRLYDSAWRRGCALCCLEEPSGIACNTSVDDDEASLDSTQSSLKGCYWRLAPPLWPSLATLLRNPWAEHSGVALSSSDADIVVVRTDVWDDYWAHFSARVGSMIDGLTDRLAADQNSTGGILTKPSRRRVLVKAAIVYNGSAPVGSGQPLQLPSTQDRLFACVLLFHARSFGAVESIHVERGIHHLQFVASQAAQYFHLWLESQTASTLTAFASVDPRSLSVTQQEEMDRLREWGTQITRCAVSAVLAPADEARVTSRLFLGPRVRLSTAHAECLLVGMMGAATVCYEPSQSGFTATFATPLMARTAVLVLQYSLWKVFGVSLRMVL